MKDPTKIWVFYSTLGFDRTTWTNYYSAFEQNGDPC